MMSIPLPGLSDNDWGVPPTERVKYQQIFNDLNPINGLLSGDKVRPVLMNSQLPVDILGRVWELSDYDKDGMLDKDEFAVAMHLVYSSWLSPQTFFFLLEQILIEKLPVDILGRVWELSDYDKDGMLDKDEFAVAMHLVYRALEKDPVPFVLPPHLIPPSKRNPKDPAAALMAGGVPAMLGLPPPTIPAVQWVVTPAEKLKFDEMFKTADTDKDGFVNGTEIKDTFLQSGLPQNTLAHIWTLCDSNLQGKLNSDEFALAMYLIQLKLVGIDPPEKLTAEMIPPSVRTQGLAQGVTEPVVDLSTIGMKELDMIQKEIDDIKGEKLQLEQERAQIEADIKIRSGEVQGLQKELDVINGTVVKLEHQKGEAQKRLDELDDRKTKQQSDIEDLKEKCNDENDHMLKLQQTISSTETTVKDQEHELRKIQEELNSLRKEEISLEEQVEASKTQLGQLTSNIAKTSTQPNQITGGMLHNMAATVPTITTNPDPFTKDDPFLNDDPFTGSDPFKSADPFAGKDPFGGASAGAGGRDSADFGSLGSGRSSSTKMDPFGGQAFGDAFSSGGNDPFAPIASGGGRLSANTLTSPINASDPFGSDPFNPSGGSKSSSRLPPPRPGKSPVPRGKSPAPPVPSLPPKQKKAPPPPRPPAPKPGPGGATSPSNTAGSDDLFGGFDPFSRTSANSNKSALSVGSNSGAGGGFADFSPSKFGAPEDQQLAWATRNSHDDWERQKKLQEQEQADLELAIKLSQETK